jgi:hypothetical protein
MGTHCRRERLIYSAPTGGSSLDSGRFFDARQRARHPQRAARHRNDGSLRAADRPQTLGGAVALQLIFAHCGLTATRTPEFGRQDHI